MKSEAEIKDCMKTEQNFYETIKDRSTDEIRLYAAGWINALMWVLGENGYNND